MKVDHLLRLYPTLYHIAEDGSWPSIQRHGLLSTNRLLDLYEVPDEVRDMLLRQRRPESVEIHHGEHGTAVVRDQKPLRPSVLKDCLEGMSVSEWLELLNGQVFFWLQQPRMERMLSAPPYRNRAHTVLHVDTSTLVEAHEHEIRLSRINSGATLFNSPRRGPDTFQPIIDYDHPQRERPRASATDVAELAVLDGVPEVARMVSRVERRQAGVGVLEVVFDR